MLMFWHDAPILRLPLGTKERNMKPESPATFLRGKSAQLRVLRVMNAVQGPEAAKSVTQWTQLERQLSTSEHLRLESSKAATGLNPGSLPEC